MSSWISRIEISTRLGHKLLLAGLSEAGKTAVKRIFFLKHGSQEVDDLSATLNYERMIVQIEDTPITIVDLGGQKVFLKRFLGSFSPFVFGGVTAFLFLIDVGNQSKFENAVQYFASCVERLEQYSPNATYYVFLHKNDLVRDSSNYEEMHNQMKKMIQKETSKPVNFFRTTIYEPETVTNGFGRLIELAMPNLAESSYVEGIRFGPIEEHTEITTQVDEIIPQTIEQEVDIPPEMGEITPGVSEKELEPMKTTGNSAVLNKLQDMMQSAVRTQQTTLEKPSLEGKKTAGDPAVLEKLGVLMKTAMKPNGTPVEIEDVPFLGAAAVEEKFEEKTLTSTVGTISLGEHPPKETKVGRISFLDDIEDEPGPDPELEKKMTHLVKFYRIRTDEAAELVMSQYNEVFEIAATSGIPVPLVLNVLLKYIPFIRSKGLNVDTLTKDKIVDILAQHIRGVVRENDLFKCFTIAAERPGMTIDEIVTEYFTSPK